MKLGVSVGLLMMGFILNASGFDAALGAEQTPQALLTMRLCFAGVPVAGLLIGIFCISRYPITAERAAETRAQLDLRHATN
jgi:GPH family glycoside/pentoside/hexuronide:cation symporter